jgi:hypothetical protein
LPSASIRSMCHIHIDHSNVVAEELTIWPLPAIPA